MSAGAVNVVGNTGPGLTLNKHIAVLPAGTIMDKTKESWTPTPDGKGMIPVNRAARRAYQKIKGGATPRPLKKPMVNE